MALVRNPNREFDALKASAAQARLPFERDAWLNLAFYLNQQYTQWASDKGGPGFLQEIPRAPNAQNTPRPVVNKIMHFVQQEYSSVLQDLPFPDVLPPTQDVQDQMDAGVGRAYCEHVADPQEADFDRALSRASLWAVICGDGYLKWTWCAGQGESDPGKVDITPVNFFELYIDPYASDFRKARYVVHSKFMDVEQVNDTWGVTVKPTGTEAADPTKTALLRGMGSAPVLSGVTVNELWMRPCRKHPDGLYVVWTGREQLIAPGPLPYNHKRLPFTQIGCIERPDSQYHMSPVTYLRPMQMELNKYHAQRIIVREKHANPKWWIPAELVLEEDPNDNPFQILRGESLGGTLEPKYIQPPSFPDNGDGAMIEEQMMHVVGLHEVSQAQVPGRVEAAKAIELLKDSDDSRQEAMRRTIFSAMGEGFFQVLELARQYETEERMILTYSRDGVAEVKHFRKGALKPGYRVRVTETSGLARSRAGRVDQLNNMWTNGILQDPEVYAELAGIPLPNVINHRAHDITLARNENLEMAEGVAVTPNSWDDHDTHLREHNTYRKTREYQALDAGTRQRFEFHCDAHDQMLDAQLVKLAKRAQLAAAAQPQAAGPAPPPGAANNAPSDG